MRQNFSVTPSAWPVFPPTTQKLHHTTPNVAAAVHQSAHPAVESEEASCLRSGAVRLLPLIRHRMFVRLSSQTIDQPSEVVSCCCRWSYQEKASCCLRQSVRLCPLIPCCTYQLNCLPPERGSVMSPLSSSVPTPADLLLHVLAEPLTSQEKKRCASTVDQSTRSRWFTTARLSGCPAKQSTSWVKKHCVAAVNQFTRAR